jgi:hypothetical protein
MIRNVAGHLERHDPTRPLKKFPLEQKISEVHRIRHEMLAEHEAPVLQIQVQVTIPVGRASRHGWRECSTQ